MPMNFQKMLEHYMKELIEDDRTVAHRCIQTPGLNEVEKAYLEDLYRRLSEDGRL